MVSLPSVFSEASSTDSEFLDQTRQWLGADAAELGKLLPQVYDELRHVAGNFLRGERVDHTLQPTALVHEAYLRLMNQRSVDWGNRAQFMAVAARMMRRILVTHAIARKTEKRGGDMPRVGMDIALDVMSEENVSAIEVNQALRRLEELDPRQAQIAELRFFGGLTVEETAEVVGISPATVKREWNVAKRWLERQLRAAA
jgi:RNA polymerase sigma factor (TIGR02999 family)